MTDDRPRFPDHHAEVETGEGPDLGWELDNVELRTVGVDIGSSTSHLLFSRLHLQRLSQSLSSRFVVVEREVLRRSSILLTPFDDGTIDAQRLEAFVRTAYAEAGVEPEDVDTGAVILTGLALERRNARAVADLFTGLCGGFVCASAGHNLEAILAAHGSGAVGLSRHRPAETVLHVDVGGGTTKLAVVRGGQVVETAALAAGARLPQGVDEMVEAVVRAARGATEERLLTPGFREDPHPSLVTFSGGVAEYVYGRETGRFGDQGPELGSALREAAERGRFGGRLAEPPEGIRATVIGASQFTVQVSGNTIHLSDDKLLPLRNVPVVDARVDAAEGSEAAVAEAVSRGLRRLDLVEGEGPVAVALSWRGEPRHAGLRALAGALARALPRSLAAGVPVVLALDADLGRSLGAVLGDEVAPSARVVSLDGIDVRELDFIDVGEVLRPAGVVPVIVKSLAFST